MRGRHILLANLALMLLLSLISGVKADIATVYITPDTIVTEVGERFTITINIKDVTDLYAWELKLDYDIDFVTFEIAEEGTFLNSTGSTFFTYAVDTFEGVVTVGCTLLGAVPGVSGSGDLVSMRFKATWSGETDLIIYDVVLLDSQLEPMPSQAIGAKVYIGLPRIPWRVILWADGYGAHVWPDMPWLSPGGRQRCYIRLRNTGNASCYVNAYFEVIHETRGVLFRLFPTFGRRIPEATIDPGPDGELFTEDDELIDPGSIDIVSDRFRVRYKGTYYIKAYAYASAASVVGPWTSWEELEEEYGGEGTSAVIGVNYFRVI